MNPYLHNEKYIERQKLEQGFEKDANKLIQQQKILKIDNFSGYFEFLHNNFLTPIYYEGILYPSVSHAFHAARSSDDSTRKAILHAESLAAVAKIAIRINDPENWQNKRLKIMEQLLRDKFRRSKELQEKLKATGNRELVMTYIEESPGNLFWGSVKGKTGQNQLGRILMKIRDDIKNDKELINWITNCFDLVKDIMIIPEISLTVNKDCTTIDHIKLSGKSFYIFGLLPTSDVVLAHPSISRIHAVILHDKNLGIVLIDLRSKAGTKLDGDVIRDHIPYRLKTGKKINFALSTRDYIVYIDTESLKRVYEKEKNKLNDDKKILEQLEKSNKDIISKSFGLNMEGEDVFVNHIPKDAVDEEIIKLFEDKFGKIKNFRCPIDSGTGYKKGFAFIQFFNKESAKDCVDYGIVSYKDRNIFLKVKYSDPKPDWSSINRDRDRRNTKDTKSNKEEIKKHIKKKYASNSSSEDEDDSSKSNSDSSSSSDTDNNSSSSSSSDTSTIKKRGRSRSRDRSRDKIKKHK